MNCSNPGPVAPEGALRLQRPAAPLCSHWTGDSSQTVSPCGVARLQGDTVKWKKAVGKRYLLLRSQHHHDQKCEERTREHFIKSDLPITGTFRILLPLKKISSSWEKLCYCKVYDIVERQLFVPVNNSSSPSWSRSHILDSILHQIFDCLHNVFF